METFWVGLSFSGFGSGLKPLLGSLPDSFWSVRALAVSKREEIERGKVFGGVVGGKRLPVEFALYGFGKAVGLVAVEVHDVGKVAAECRIACQIGYPSILVVEIVEVRSAGFVPRPLAVETGGSRTDLVETDGLSELLKADEQAVFAEHLFRGFPTCPLFGLGPTPVVQGRADYVNVFVAGPIVFEGGAKRHVFRNRSVELAMHERRALRGDGVLRGEIERIHGEDHLERIFRKGVFPRQFAHVAESAAEICRMRRPRIPSSVHFVHRAEQDLHLKFSGRPEKTRVRVVVRSRCHLGCRIAERGNRDVIDASGTEKGYGTAEVGIGAGAVIVVDERNGGDPRSRVTVFDAQYLLGEVMFRAKSGLDQMRNRRFRLQKRTRRGRAGKGLARKGRSCRRRGNAGSGNLKDRTGKRIARRCGNALRNEVRQSEKNECEEGFRKGSESLRHQTERDTVKH